MSGKKGTVRNKTLKDSRDVRKELRRLAKKWGWKLGEFSEYALRMGVNRCLALERWNKAAAAPKKAKAAKRKAKPAKTAPPPVVA